MDIQGMINDYTNWLNKEFSFSKVGEAYELTTPYLDRFNDHLQVYVEQRPNGQILLTDDGYIMSNLLNSGISISRSPKRKAMLDRVIRNFGVTLNGDALEIRANRSDFPRKKHMLIQTMLTVDDMFSAETSPMKNFFTEEVGLFLDSKEIYYSRDFSLSGKTGSLYVYDYHLQRTRTKPERFCKAINRVTESSRNLTLFNWIDTVEKREDKGQLILFLNDEKNIDREDLDAFRSYDVNCILWSQRDDPQNMALLA